ncbi:MAG: MSMEG_6728 family protein, partial [Mycobacteriales bacterium]
MQTFLPYPDLAASCAVLDDRRLGKQRVEVFQVLRALTWPTYAWKSHPAVRMWRGFVPALVRYGVEACREWSRRGFGDALQEQLLAWSGGTVPEDPSLPPWFGAEPLHLSHRSNLLRKDPQHYRPLFAALGSAGEPEDLPYLWPPDVFPHWPLRPGLGLVPRPFQERARDAVLDGRDVLLVARPGSGGTTAGLLAGLAVPGRTALVVPPLGPPAPPAPPVTGPAPGDRVPGTAAVPLARPPGPEDLAAMAAEAQPSPWAVGTRLPAGPLGLVVLDGADAVEPVPRPAAPLLAVVGQTADPAALAARHGLRDPLRLGAGWELDRFLATADGRPRQVVAGEPRPVLVR